MTLKTSDQLVQIERRLEEIEKWKKTTKILCDQSKKPHKCPNCNGIGRGVIGELKGLPIQTNCCHSCDGKGIVWG